MDLDMSMMPLPPGFDASIFEARMDAGSIPQTRTRWFDSNYTVRMRNKVNVHELARLSGWRHGGDAGEI